MNVRYLCIFFGVLAAVPVTMAFAASQTPAPHPGKVVFDRWCSSCHGPKTDSPGTGALAVKYSGELPAQIDRRTDLNPDVVKFFVRQGVSVMPSFRKTEISDAELNQLAAYLSRRR